MAKLSGKVALVTGSAHGIGKAIAYALAREGADLVIADRDEIGMALVARGIAGLGVKAEAVTVDVTSEPQIVSLFSKAMDRFGRVDILVNNAGVFGGGPIESMNADAWDRVIATDLRAPFLCTREAFKIMKKQGGGRIINISSISAHRVRQNNAAYSAAKAGLVNLTHSTALEGRSFGVNCGCLCPGEVLHEGRPIEMQKEPYMTPDETAAAVVYMACLPPHVNVLELVQLPREQLYIGRG
jgi:NAD(P)-dependent dehydrogenase (short-subunit alcohol dehydrogenase family)